MFEPTEREFDDDVQRSMEMFERAQIGDLPPIVLRTPSRLLLALDGSSQDEMSRQIAGRLRDRFGCTLDVVDGREDGVSDDTAEKSAQALDANLLPKTLGDSYEQILAAADRSRCDLLIVPSPFERDLAKVGTDSTGTVIDVLLTRSPVPLLVVRGSYELADPPFSAVSIVVVSENEATPHAAEWAAGLIAPGGELQLTLLLETEIYENVRELIRSLDPDLDLSQEALAEAMQRSRVRLHRALQKTAVEAGFQYRLSVQQQDDRPLAELQSSERHALIVLPLERQDHLSQGFVHDRIRHSADALLVVPSTRPQS